MFQSFGSCLSHGDVVTLQCLPIMFRNVTTALLLFAGIVALFLIAYGGIKLIMSGGDAKQITAARGIIVYAIVGLFFVLTSFALVLTIGYITKTTPCIGFIENITKTTNNPCLPP